MARRSSSPALYEVLQGPVRTRPAEAPFVASSPATAPAGGAREPSDWSWLSPGRVIRLPVGYVLLSTAILLAMVVAVYMFGFGRGQQAERAAIDQQLVDRFQADQVGLATEDPLLATESGTRGIPGATGTPRSPGAASPGAQPASGPGLIESDPRVPGMTHVVIAHYPHDSAMELARFCRSQGLEAYVLRGNNARFSQVIVLPLFERGYGDSPQYQRHRQRLADVGRLWHRKNPRENDDLGGAYAETHR